MRMRVLLPTMLSWGRSHWAVPAVEGGEGGGTVRCDGSARGGGCAELVIRAVVRVGWFPVLWGVRVMQTLLVTDMAMTLTDVYKLCVAPAQSQPQDMRLTRLQVVPYLVCCRPIGVINVRVDRDVHVNKVVVQRLPRSDISVIWHVPIVPVVDALHGLALMWGIILVLGSIKVDLDKFGQIGPTDRRACILHLLGHAALGTAHSVGWPP
jgi:hypothetical protein